MKESTILIAKHFGFQADAKRETWWPNFFLLFLQIPKQMLLIWNISNFIKQHEISSQLAILLISFMLNQIRSVLSNIPDSHVGYYMTIQNDNWRHIYIYIWSFKTKKMFKPFLKPLWTFSYRDNKNTVNVNYSCDRNIIFIFSSHIRRKLLRNKRDYRIVLTWSLPLY